MIDWLLTLPNWVYYFAVAWMALSILSNWFFLFPLWLAFNIVAYFGAWILGFFPVDRLGPIDNNNGTGVEPRLPERLSWFDTFDNSLLGDGAWKRMEAGHWAWRSKLANWPRLQAYLGRVGWLMRNPGYGFERSVMSATILPDSIVVISGDPFIQDQPNGKEGFCFVRIDEYWGLFFIKEVTFYHFIIPALALIVYGAMSYSFPISVVGWLLAYGAYYCLSGRKCLNISLGWKIKTYAEDAGRVRTQPVAQYVVSPRISTFKPA